MTQQFCSWASTQQEGMQMGYQMASLKSVIAAPPVIAQTGNNASVHQQQSGQMQGQLPQWETVISMSSWTTMKNEKSGWISQT